MYSESDKEYLILEHINDNSIQTHQRDNVAEYRNATERYVSNLKSEGYHAIRLTGPTELDFILEWACMKQGL